MRFKPLESTDLRELDEHVAVVIATIDDKLDELWLVDTLYLDQLRQYYRDTCKSHVVLDVVQVGPT